MYKNSIIVQIYLDYKAIDDIKMTNQHLTFTPMTAKELQELYALNNPQKQREIKHVANGKPLNEHIAAHVRSTALDVAKRIGVADGERIIREGFSSWPDLVDGEVLHLRTLLEK